MTLIELLEHCAQVGVELSAEGDRLRCRTPKGGVTSELREQLTSYKTEILQFLRDTPTVAPITFMEREGELPLSFAQKRLWFIDQLTSHSAVYNIPTAVRLTGSLDISALEASINEIICRHEVLRTSFKTINGQPIQVIADKGTIELTPIDLSHLCESEREAAIEQWFVQNAQQPFELEQAPLIRETLLHLNPTEHVVLFTLHHIISDGWSMGILLRELVTLYNAFSQGRPSPLPQLPIQYVDVAHWQRQSHQQEMADKQLDYWKRQLADAPPLLELPTDRPRPAVQTFRGATHPFTLSTPLYNGLKAMGQQEGVTLFMILLAAFKTLLHRYTRQDDISVGTPIAGRNSSQMEGLIGLFVNSLVLRTDLSDNPSFRTFLGQVREVALGAYNHQEVPFEKLVEELQPQRDLGHNPLFQVMFVYQNDQMPLALDLAGVTMQRLTIASGMARFDLTLDLSEAKAGVQGWFEYNTDLFDAATIARMVDHFQTLLIGIVADPDQRLSDLPLLTAAERQQVVLDWNQTQIPYPRELCIHQLFEAQVERTPDAIAVVFENQSITYRDLNQQSNQLARHLQKLGVKPGVMVAVYMQRSLEMITALLGILKAGGGYVPLVTNFPEARLHWILDSLDVPCILTQQSLLPTIANLNDLPALHHVVCLDESVAASSAPLPAVELPDRQIWATAQIQQHASDNLLIQSQSTDTAYIIFTSGSTGTPKGVMVTHQPVINLIDWVNRTFQINSRDRVLFITSICFDLSVYDIFGLLAAGGSIQVVSDDDVHDPHRLLDLIHREPITFWDSAPATLQQLVPFFSTASPQDSQLRLVFMSGDWIPVKLPDLLKQTFPGVEVIGLGGATEATVWSNYYLIHAVESHWLSIPYGKPIQNAQYYVLDHYHQPCPIGIPGHLYIGGECLSSGYVNQPELTAAKFIPDPFHPHPDRRLYHTGDLARFLFDGNIEFLGRIDHQVKVRGFRIELGEIDTVLNQHPAVQDTLVLVREDVPGDKRLVAYVVSEAETQPTSNDLRNFLKQKLPEYMIPAAFVLLPALPLTVNGKVDRRALPAPDIGYQERQIVVPRNSIEETLANIWSQVLNIESVSIHDNFFELGGDSILSIQVISRAQQCGLQLTPKQLFQCQTIAELATVAGTELVIQAEQGLVTGAVPLTPIQHWFFEQDLPERHHWNQSVLLQVRQPLKVDLLEKAVQQLLQHHDALRLRFMQQELGWQQINEDWVDHISIDAVDLSALTVTEQEAAIAQTTIQLQTSLNLSEGSLLKVAYFNLGTNQPDRLFWVIHHLAVDGVSWRILLEDLQIAYHQLWRGEAVQLPLKTTSFQHWSQRLTEHAQSAAVWQDFKDWLANTWKPTMRLPIDHGAGANTEASARKISMRLNAVETRVLLQEVPKAYRTKINEILLTALAEALSPWLNSRTVLIDLESHGREDLIQGVDLSRTVGWFTALYPVLLDLGLSDEPGDRIKSIKEQLRHVSQQGLSYGLLRSLSTEPVIGETLRTLPQAEVSFNYLGQLDLGLPEQSLFQLDQTTSTGSMRSPNGNRTHLLEINGCVIGGQLQIDWIYSENLHQRETIAGLAQALMSALQLLMDHCQAPMAGGYTPSDFPLVKLDQPTLDALLQVERNIEAIYPLTPMQQNMLLHRLHVPESGLNVVHQVFPLRGVVLDQSIFEQSWQQVIDTHPILRTSFSWKNQQEPLQIIHQRTKLPLEEHDWRHLSDKQQSGRLEAYIQSIRMQNFDLTQVPQVRTALFRTGKDAYYFVWIYNYMLLDGWSSAFLMKEFFACYEAYSQGHAFQLESSRSYRDYIAWLQQQDLSKAEAFWRQTLKGLKVPTTLQLQSVGQSPDSERGVPQVINTDPVAALRSLLIKQQQLNQISPGTLMRRVQTLMSSTPSTDPVPEDEYVQQLNVLSEATTTALRDLAKQQQVTLNTLVQAAWSILLSRYSAESEVVFGVTVSGRPTTLTGVEAMVGLFINTLPLRVKVPPQASFLTWLKGLQEQQVELSQYEYSSPVQIKAWSEVLGDLPLFRSYLVFENFPIDTTVQDQVKRWGIDYVRSLAQTEYLLRVEVVPSPILLFSLSYYQRHFDTAQIISLLGYFQGVLEAIASNPDQNLTTLMHQAVSYRETFLQKLLNNVRLQQKDKRIRHLKKSLLLSLLVGALWGGFFWVTHRKETPLLASPSTAENTHSSSIK